ncbi:MAG: PDZ domain-containing protein [Tahibacter sp.]
MYTTMKYCFFLIGSSLMASALAQGSDVEQRMRDEMQLAFVRMLESGTFEGHASDSLSFTLDEPSRRVTNLGLLVDSTSAQRMSDGLHVLGVSPNSTAQHMGVRAGDVVTSVNGTPLAALGVDAQGRPRAPAVLREHIAELADEARVEFGLLRDGKAFTAAAPLVSVMLPPIHLQVGRDELVADNNGFSQSRKPRDESVSVGSTGCGRLNWFDVAPRQQHLFAANLLSIDGNTPGPHGITRYQLSAGEHTLKIGENIEDGNRLPFSSRLRHENDIKTLTITVVPNTTYYLAARLNMDKLTEWKDGGYWDPVVWKEVSEDCH